MIISCTRIGDSFFLSNGKGDRSMSLKTLQRQKIQMGCQEHRGGRMGNIMDRTWAIVGVCGSPRVSSSGFWKRFLFQ